MKIRGFAGAAAVIMTALLGSPALADTLLGCTYAGCNPLAPMPGNASPNTLEPWLETLLGGPNQAHYVSTFNFSTRTLSDFYPGYDWDYAIVKFGQNYAAYSDSDSNNRLSFGGVQWIQSNISNVTFYVPEPAALLLVGTGLVTAAPFVWSRRRRV